MAEISVLMTGKTVLISRTPRHFFEDDKSPFRRFGKAFEISRKTYILKNKAVTKFRTVYKEKFEPLQTNANKAAKSLNRPAFCH